MTLEQIIRDLAKRGEITHITLAPCGKTDIKQPTVWQAGFRKSVGNAGYVCKIGRDPVDVLIDALTGRCDPIEARRSRGDRIVRNLKEDLV